MFFCFVLFVAIEEQKYINPSHIIVFLRVKQGSLEKSLKDVGLFYLWSKCFDTIKMIFLQSVLHCMK